MLVISFSSEANLRRLPRKLAHTSGTHARMLFRYGASPRSQVLKYHLQTSGRSLHAQEFNFNDIRTTLQVRHVFVRARARVCVWIVLRRKQA